MDMRYNSSNNTSPAVAKMKSERPRYKTSFFNLSKMKHINGTIGTIMPIDWFPVFPGDDLNLDYIIDSKLRNPLSKNAMTGFKVYVHAYFSRMSDLWEGAENFTMYGDTGKIQLKKPAIGLTETFGSAPFFMNTPLSLFDYLDLPSCAYDNTGHVDRLRFGYGVPVPLYPEQINNIKTIPGRPSDVLIDALPFVMYQQIYIHKYMNYNLVQENRNFVPLNQKHLLLPYNAPEHVNVLSYTTPYINSFDSTYIATDGLTLDPDSVFFVPTSEIVDTPVYLGALRYRQFEGDYFTTASPFDDLVRGGLPTLNFEDATTNWNDVFNIEPNGHFVGNLAVEYNKKNIGLTPFYSTSNNTGAGTYPLSQHGEKYVSSPSNFVVTDNLLTGELAEIFNKVSVDNVNLNMDDLYTIEALTLFRRRNAMTNGRYNELVEAQFGINPKSNNHEPIYLGGSTFDLLNQTIIQTSQSTVDSKLGELGGQMSGNGFCQCGRLHANDFGYVMVLMSVIPDSYYVDGLPRKFTLLEQKDVYSSPLLNQLPPDNILNRELFISGDDSIDSNIFAWKERFSEYKSRQNSVHGLMAIPDFEDSAYVSQRKFDDTPSFNNSFVSISPGNVDMNIFSVTDEPPFIFSVGCSVRGRRPFPFATIPGGSQNPNLG